MLPYPIFQMSEKTQENKRHFIQQIIDADNASGKRNGAVVTRFPPEPNGYLHIGHAKSICLNFGLGEEFGGRTHLRFDDTNPTKEEQQYIDGIKRDVAWLGFSWGEHEYYASNYFEQLYTWAEQLIEAGKAFVCDLTGEEMRAYRGTLTSPGRESPFRSRTPEENLQLFRDMRAGKFADGAKTLRAKIDMASPNLNLRDPVMYRINRAAHPKTGTTWCIYPTYDWAHGQSDSIEGVTHSICTLEFEDHRPLYDWYCKNLGIHHPQQIEFARLNVTYMLTSKRKLLQLVEAGYVDGWDDPRMPTLSGLRRRGFTPEAIRAFCERIGVTKFNAKTDYALLLFHLREHLNKAAERRMVVMNPLKVVIENYPDDQVEELDAVNNPEDEAAGSRMVPFTREIFIERDDFMEDAPRKFFRLAPGREVRLRWAYFITCTGVEKDADGNIVELRATYDPETKGGNAPDGRKVKGTIHWVSASAGKEIEVRKYDQLFLKEDPNDVAEGEDFTANINPDSLETVTAMAEPALIDAEPGSHLQFERVGYFCVDTRDSEPGRPVFNLTAPLRDGFAKKG